jgi:aspartate aminotransferase-like enzyme
MYIVPGSSSAVMEASVNSVIEQDTEIIVELSGFFSHRFREMVSGCGGKVIPLEVPYGKAVDPDAVRKILRSNPRIKAMTVVHNESSTGVVNPVAEIASVCHEFGVLLICDCVSSMGGVDIPTDNWELDYCLTGAQKCLQSPPGIGIICLSEKVWEYIDKRSIPVHGWFLNLSNIRDYCIKWKDWHGHGPVTAPTSLYAALDASLDLIMKEGLKERFARHILNKQAVRKSLEAAGIKLFVEDKIASNTVTTMIVPDGVDEKKVLSIMKKEFNTLVAGTPGDLGTKLIRIGHMGVTSDKNLIRPTIMALLCTFKKLGAKVDMNAAVETMMEIYKF